MNEAPTAGGQTVRNTAGRIGITTDAPRARSGMIPVQFVGANYPVMVDPAELAVVTLAVTS